MDCSISDTTAGSVHYNHHRSETDYIEYPTDLDIVVYFAAHAKVHDLVVDPAKSFDNMMMTFNVLEFCRQNQIPIIFSSSREVYGDIYCYITDETNADFAYTESPYSASKICGEAYVYSYAQYYGVI